MSNIRMNKKSTQVLAVAFTLLIIIATVLMYLTYFDCQESDVLIISIIFSILSLIMCAFTVLDVFIGKRQYYFKKDTIIVGRKGKMIDTIHKSAICSPILILDCQDGSPRIFLFSHGGKKHRIFVDNDKLNALKTMLSGVKIKTRDNAFEYLILYLLEIFCV